MRSLVFSLLLGLGSLVSAQPATLFVATETPDAFVVVDGDVLGTAARGPFQIEAGTVAVALVEPTGAWDGRRAETEVTLAPGDTASVELNLPVRTRIESLPLHASVVLVHADGTEERLGTTPLVVDREEGLQGQLIARLDGHMDAVLEAPASGGRVAMVLRPEDLAVGETFTHSLPTRRSNPRRTAIDVSLGALAVAAGAVAVHYKFQADAADDAYRQPQSLSRGEITLLNDAKRFDTLSGVALGVSTTSLGILALRFALR
ncbi:MAG: hypothetical protein AAGI52_09980 [Bacteroidota bacterium]